MKKIYSYLVLVFLFSINWQMNAKLFTASSDKAYTSFPPPCSTITTFPYNYGFEDVPSNSGGNWNSSCWSADPQDTGSSQNRGPYRWTVTNTNTPTGNTGPSGPHSGSKYAYTEATGSYNGSEAKLISPVFDMSSLSSPQITFYYYMYGSGIGTLSLDVYDGSTWTNDVWSVSGQLQTSDSSPWAFAFVSIPANTTQFRFRAIRADTHFSDMAVDDISVMEEPACLTPVGLSTSNAQSDQIDLNWTPRGSETAWNIEYGQRGFIQGQGTTISVSNNSYTLTGLTPSTYYDYYVQADCGSGDTSYWVGPYTFNTITDIVITSFPYNYGFEDAGAISSGWSQEYVSGYVDYTFQDGGHSGNPASAHSGSYNALFYSGNRNGNKTKLVSPFFDLTGINNPILSFWHAQKVWSGDQDELRVYYRTNPNGQWTLISGQEYTSSIEDWTQVEFVYLPNPSSSYQIAFEGLANYGYGIVLDDIMIGAPPSCMPPTNLSVSNIHSSQAELSWDTVGNETAWNIEYGPEGFIQGQGTTISVLSNPYTLTGLTSPTSYDYYVQADCGGGDTSFWAGPYTFRTICETITSYPYHYGFENVPTNAVSNWDSSCWSADPQNVSGSNLPYAWTVGDDNTNSHFTGPDVAHSGTQFAYTRTNGSYGDQAKLISQDFDMSSLTNPQLSFFYFMHGDYIGTLSLDIYDGAIWTNDVWTMSGEQQTSYTDYWLPAYINIPKSTVKIRFRAIKGYGIDTEIAIDDITVIETPSCLVPTDLSVSNVYGSQVELSWTPRGSETGWNIEYGPAGFIQGQGTTISVLNHPYILTGLTPETAYDFYVQADCGGGDTSNWSDSFSFTTDFASVSLPYSNNFDSDDDYWTIENANGDPEEWRRTTYFTRSCVGNNNDYVLLIYANLSGANMDDWLFSPPFDLTSGVTYALEFSYGNDGNIIYTEDMDVFLSTDNNSTSGAVGTQLLSVTGISNGCHNFIDTRITVPTSGTYHIAFHGKSPGDQDVLMIDDFAFYETSSCYAPTDLSVSNITETQVDLSWTAGNVETAWNLEYGPDGFTQGQGTTVSLTTNVYNLTGLTPGTVYDYYVQADCGNGETSPWTGPYTFSTTCLPITVFPYNYGFEDVSTNSGADWIYSCWFADPQNTGALYNYPPFRWTVINGATSSSYTGPNHAHSGTQYAYTEATNSLAGDEALLISPVFDMTSLTSPQVAFYYFMYGDNIGTLSLDIYDGATWTNDVWTISGEQQLWEGDPWQKAKVVIPQNTTQLRFRGIRGSDDTSDIAIDDITISEAPTCPEPTALSASNIQTHQVELSWTAGSSETTWNIEYGTEGFTQGQGTTLSVSTNPYTLTGLSPVTSYDYYIQADCGGGDTSIWSGPYTFTTHPGCGDIFYDNGGALYTYDPLLNETYTFYPENTGNVVTVSFDIFSVENGYDGMMIYDGIDTNAPIFDSGSTYNRSTCPNGAWTGSNGSPYAADGESFTATNSYGALTFVFTSDFSTEYSGWKAFITCAPAALSDYKIKGFKFYPNPVNHTLNITAANNIQLVRIYNVTGQEVIETKPDSNQTQIDMSRLQNGVYFVKAQINDELTAFKVVKK